MNDEPEFLKNEKNIPLEHCEASIQEFIEQGYEEISKMLGTIPRSALILLSGEKDGKNPTIVFSVGSINEQAEMIHSAMLSNEDIAKIIVKAMFGKYKKLG